MRRLLLATALLLIPVAPAAAGAGKPVGFKVTVPDGQKIECSYVSLGPRLQCLNYTRVVDEQCDAGGPVYATELRRTGKPRNTFFCVDEGYHGWSTLKPGKTWKSGPFKCWTTRKTGALRCSNKSATHTIVAPT
jgi:hypothetical protein